MRCCHSSLTKWRLCSLSLKWGKACDYGRNNATWLLKLNHKITWSSLQDALPQYPVTPLWGCPAAKWKRLCRCSPQPQLRDPSYNQTCKWPFQYPAFQTPEMTSSKAQTSCSHQARTKLHIHEQNKWWCFKPLNFLLLSNRKQRDLSD